MRRPRLHIHHIKVIERVPVPGNVTIPWHAWEEALSKIAILTWLSTRKYYLWTVRMTTICVEQLALIELITRRSWNSGIREPQHVFERFQEMLTLLSMTIDQLTNSVVFFRLDLLLELVRTCRLFDLRTNSEQMIYAVNVLSCALSISFSSSGRLLFAGYDYGYCHIWDTLKGTRILTLPHDDRVSCLAVSRDGTALCTGCWDYLLRIWTWIRTNSSIQTANYVI